MERIFAPKKLDELLATTLSAIYQSAGVFECSRPMNLVVRSLYSSVDAVNKASQ